MANEVEIIEYKGRVDNLQKGLREAEASFVRVEKTAKKSVDKTEATFNGLGNSIKNALSSLPLGNVVNQLDDAANSARNVSSAVGGIAPAANQGTKAVNILAQALKVGVLGALAAIIFAFSSVVAFFKQTDEGAARLEGIFNGLSSSIDVVTGRMAVLGNKIVDTFSEEGALSGVKKFTGFIGDAGIGLLKFLTNYDALVKAGLKETILFKAVTGFTKDVKDAYTEGERLTIELDAIQDAMRGLSVETRQTELQIAALLKQTRNKGLDIGERLNIVSKAFELENKNLTQNFDLQKQYYENIARTNFLKLEAINSDKKAQLSQVKTIINQIEQAKTAEDVFVLYNKQLEAQEGLRSVSDEVAQKQTDAALNLVELAGRSAVAEEKFAAIRSQLIEKDIADRIEAIKIVERQRETSAINIIKTEEELALATLNIQIESLEKQKKVLESYGKDVSQINLDIAKLRQKYEDDALKADQERAEKRKQQREKESQEEIKALDIQLKRRLLANESLSLQDKEIQRKNLVDTIAFNDNKIAILKNKGIETVDLERENLALKKKLYKEDQDAFNNAQNQKLEKVRELANQTLASGRAVTDEIFSRNQQAFEDELQNNQQITDTKIANLQKEKEQGVISEAKYNEAVNRLNQEQARKEREIKRQQAQAEKNKALFDIAINTAVAVVKAAHNPFLIALAVATGAIQAGIVASRPLPKFARGVIGLKGNGTETSDSIPAMLSKNESVMTAKETREHGDTLWAIRNNKLDEHANKAWVLPAIRKLEKQRRAKEDTKERMMSRMYRANKQMNLEHLERLTARNSKVGINNIEELASAINRYRPHDII